MQESLHHLKIVQKSFAPFNASPPPETLLFLILDLILAQDLWELILMKND